jgi:hypothetical protein
VLGHELLAVGEIVGEVAVNIVGPGHQDVHEVVHHDRDLGAINRLEQLPTVRGRGSVGHEASVLPPIPHQVGAHRERCTHLPWTPALRPGLGRIPPAR